MLCYRDMTFCASNCTNNICARFVSRETELKAQKMGFYLSLADFSKDCFDYKQVSLPRETLGGDKPPPIGG